MQFILFYSLEICLGRRSRQDCSETGLLFEMLIYIFINVRTYFATPFPIGLQPIHSKENTIFNLCKRVISHKPEAYNRRNTIILDRKTMIIYQGEKATWRTRESMGIGIRTGQKDLAMRFHDEDVKGPSLRVCECGCEDERK